jgi:glycosyltransferase involved in cell wall biosynthesis
LWDEAKNVAAIQLASQALPWPVYFAGDATDPSGEGALPLPCRTVGRLSPAMLATFYGRASIYVSPALYEPFGLSVLEAALSECALVLSDIPTFRELWNDAAVFVPATDTDQLIKELMGLIHDHARREELAHEARRRALRYSATAMAAGYLGVYRGLLAPEESARRESAA